MSRAFLILTASVTLVASFAAWHWRVRQADVIQRLQQARASRPHRQRANVTPPLPLPAAPRGTAVSPARPAEIAPAEFRAAMSFEAVEARRARNPRLLELQRKKLRLELLQRSNAFFRGRKLSPEAMEQLLEIWIERELAQQDLRVVANEMGLPLWNDTIMQVSSEVRKRMQNAETSLLGPEGTAALADYRRTQGVRDVVANFQGDSILAGYPLTVDQVDAVTAVLLSSSVTGRPFPRPSQIDPGVAAELLAGVISQEQIDLLLVPLREHISREKLYVMLAERPPDSPGK